MLAQSPDGTPWQHLATLTLSCVMASLLQFITQEVEYLKVLEETQSLLSEDWDQTLLQRKAIVLNQIRQEEQCSASVATDIIKLLQHSPFNMAARSEICGLINTLVQNMRAGHTGMKHKQHTQSCMNLQRYIPNTVWTHLQGDGSYAQKMSMFCNFVSDGLGISNGNESTYVHMTAVFRMGCQSGAVDINTIDHTDAHTILRDMKDIIRKDIKRMRLPHQGAILLYPPTVQEFRAQYPKAFRIAYPESGEAMDINFLPAKLPLDESQLQQLSARLPKRCSHQAISGRVTKCQSVSNSGQAIAQALLQQVMQNVNMRGIQQSSLPGLQILNPPRRSTLDDVQQPLALQDLQQPPTSCSPPLAQHVGDASSSSSSPADSLFTPQKTKLEPLKNNPELEESEQKDVVATHNVATIAEDLIKVLRKGKCSKAMKRPACNNGAEEPISKQAMKRPACNDGVKNDLLIYRTPQKGDVITYQDASIVVDMPSACWRVKRDGKPTKCASFATNKTKGWEKVVKILTENQ